MLPGPVPCIAAVLLLASVGCAPELPAPDLDEVLASLAICPEGDGAWREAVAQPRSVYPATMATDLAMGTARLAHDLGRRYLLWLGAVEHLALRAAEVEPSSHLPCRVT